MNQPVPVVPSIFTVLLVAWLLPTASSAQDRLFGSVDDPAEQSNVAWWQTRKLLSAYGGLSLIGPQWRSEGRLNAEFRTHRWAVLLSGALRTGIYGTYEPDIDEPYDLLRLVNYVRFRDPRSSTYLRLGPLDRTRLGTGHLVNFLRSEAAWDERTVGLEFHLGSRYLGLSGFSDNIGFNGIAGMRLALKPLAAVKGRLMRSVEVAINGIQDLSNRSPSDKRFNGYHAEILLEAVRSGAFSVHPFVSYARISNGGQGLNFGADLRSDNFIDLARLHFRLAVHYNSRRFLPGYVGSFWQVNSDRARILDSRRGIAPTGVANPIFLAGTDLERVGRSHSVVSELRLLIFERFEFWYQFMRHYGTQPLSESHIRIYVRSHNFQLAIGQDRGGLRNFFSLFGRLGDLSILRFESSYRIAGPAWLLLDARYTYTRVRLDMNGENVPPGLFSVERRFDPLIGLRFSF